MRMSLLCSPMAALVLTACAVGPNYVAPTSDRRLPVPSSPSRWRAPSRRTLRPIDGGVSIKTQSLTASSRMHLRQTQTSGPASHVFSERGPHCRRVGADRLPGSDLQAGVNRQRSPLVQTLPGINQDNTVVDGGISVAYEVDLFGRVRRGVEAARRGRCCTGGLGRSEGLGRRRHDQSLHRRRERRPAPCGRRASWIFSTGRCASHLGENELD
jgi:hypothetical protein